MGDYDAEWDELAQKNKGRQEALQIGTIKSIKDGAYFDRFKDVKTPEEGLNLVYTATKAIATFEDAIQENIAIERLSGFAKISKMAIEKAVKAERRVISDKHKEEIKKSNARYKVPKGLLEISDYEDNVEIFYQIQPFFYDKSRMFWFWNKDNFCYEIVDEVDVMRTIDMEMGLDGKTIASYLKTNYIEAFKRVGRGHIPKDAPKKWIQFKDKAYSLKSGKVYKVTPDYFFTNPIPWDMGESTETPVMDKLFTDWMGEDGKVILYELIAYCCYSDYPIQLLFCLCGNGRNGKSQFMKILDRFIGKNNTSTTELDVLTQNRFESFKLYKKLVCTMGETNFGMLTATSIIKKLIGGDKIGFEKKNKDPFDDYNYAKIIIASNSLPTSADTSDGFYRRWFIISFDREFEESGREVWLSVPDEEYRNMARKVTEILPNLLGTGVFTRQGSIEDRKRRYISFSNPLSLFIKEYCIIEDGLFESYNKMYSEYVRWLQNNKKRRVTWKEFKSALEDDGFYVERTTKIIRGDTFGEDIHKTGMWIMGLQLKIIITKE